MALGRSFNNDEVEVCVDEEVLEGEEEKHPTFDDLPESMHDINGKSMLNPYLFSGRGVFSTV